VGTRHYETFFKLIDWALKDKDTTAVVTSTTFPEVRYKTYQQEDFSRRYMWPNTALPSVTTLINMATKASKNRFSVKSVENHGAHYPRTLRDWGRRLEANVTMEMMAKRYPELGDPAVFETFMRKWRYLFAYAAAGYAKGHIMSHVLTFYKVRNGEFFLWTLKSNIYCRMECLHCVLNRWECRSYSGRLLLERTQSTIDPWSFPFSYDTFLPSLCFCPVAY